MEKEKWREAREGEEERSIDTFEFWRQIWPSHPRGSESTCSMATGRGSEREIDGEGAASASATRRGREAEAANFMRNCSVENFSGWGSRRWRRETDGRVDAQADAQAEATWSDRQVGHMERKWMPPLPPLPPSRRRPPKFFGGILINF